MGTQELSETKDVVRPDVVQRMLATLGAAPEPLEYGHAAPLLSHWLCFLPSAPTHALGEDGHPRLAAPGGAMDLPRRMWAGSTIAFHRPLRIGAALTRRSTIGQPQEKVGRSGRMAFVQAEHAIGDADGAVLSEAQEIVYREAARPTDVAAAPQPAPADPQWARRIDPDPILLFRYSALTFNSHRIHYDRRYAIEHEGYAGLVVHGPLVATLLLHELCARHPGIDVATYRFRAVRPLFDTGPFWLCGTIGVDGVGHLFARDETGALCVEGTATLR